MTKTHVKTFVQNLWYRRDPLNLSTYEEVVQDPPERSIDEQVDKWVQSVDAVIIHPGQLGMHTTWHGTKDDPYQLKCLTLGLSVLYTTE